MSGWKDIVPGPRHTARRMRVAIRGSVLKVLNELITNSDDSYYRLEKKGKKASGLIQIGFWKKKKIKRSTIEAFCIRDLAEGISSDTIETKFGKYGEDTAGETRRGYFGQGAKDALCNMQNSVLLSIQNGQISCVRFMMENPGPREQPKYLIEDNNTAQQLLKSYDDKTKSFYKLRPDATGTFIFLEVPSDRHSPRENTLVEGLQTFYMLRKILSDPKRRVQLINHNSGKVMNLKHTPIFGEVILSESFVLSYDSLEFEITLTVLDAVSDLDQKASDRREGGLLVVDEDDAVLDLTLFGYDDNSSAASLTGEVRIKGFKKLFQTDASVVIESREGLDYAHPFNKLLRDEVRKRLVKEIERLGKEKAAKELVVDQKLDKQIKKAFARINYLMRKEAEKEPEKGTGDDEEPLKKPENGMIFRPSVVHIEREQVKTVYLVVDAAKIPPDSIVNITCDNPKIDVDPIGSISVPEDLLTEGLIKIPIDICGDQPGERATITARFGLIEASLFVTITDIIEIVPPSGFDFVPDRTRVYQGRKTHLKLLIDTKVVRPATLISIDSDNPQVAVTGAKVGGRSIEDPRMFPLPRSDPTSIAVVLVEIEGRKAQQKGTITAKAIDKQAFAQVRVIEKKPKRGYFNDYKLDSTKDARLRFSFDSENGMVYVHLRAPVVQQYLGPEGEHIINGKERTPQAFVMLGEVILQCICRQWAKYRYTTGFKEYLSPENEAAKREEEESEARQIDFEYGTQIHEWILGEYFALDLRMHIADGSKSE